MPRTIATTLAALLLLAACGGEPQPEATPTASPTPEATSSPEPTPTPTPTPTPEPEEEDTAPLTGEVVEDAAALERPVVAVKIDNNPKALPQDGVEHADITISELVEGGATRFISLFHSTDPGEVGPVRSGREVDILLMPAWSPVFAYSGAAAEVVRDLQGSGLFLRTEGDPGWSRRSRPGVAREHTLYVDVSEQFDADADLPVPTEPWPFDAEVTDGGSEVEGMTLVYSRETTVSWNWDDGSFLRQQYDEPHVTESGEQISAANVVVPLVEIRPGPRGGGTVTIDVVGEGDAFIFRDGQVFEARWRKESAEDHFEWLMPNGDPFPLAPGKTWIELVPTSGQVSPLLVPADESDEDVELHAPDEDASPTEDDADQ